MYPDSFINEVRNAASIVETVGGYVALKKRGRNHQGLCPFHTEKTPSFNVSDERQWYHCFGCGASGDIFKFLTQVENLNFPEAVRWVAEKYGIPLPKQTPVDVDNEKDRDRVLEATQAAEAFFVQMLDADAEGREARRYLTQRGICDETIQRFAIGYAPGSGGQMVAHLGQKGFEPVLLEKAGLVKKSEVGRGYYDSFRRRIIFPIKDLRGRTIAFGGRVLDDGVPKYLNSSETVVYTKSRHLFGLCFAKENIRKMDYAILVEGYLDCIVPFQEGIGNVVASLGTSLTSGQARILSRYTRNIVVNYDPDVAGVNATRRSLDLLLEEGFRVNVMRLPEGQDPDSFIRHSGVSVYRQLLRQSEPYLEFLAEQAVRMAGAGSGRGKVKALNSVLPFLAKVRDRVERLEYVSKIAHRFRIEDSVILAELKKAAVLRSKTLDEQTISVLPEVLQAERDLIRVLLGDENLGRAVMPLIDREGLEDLRTGAILKGICDVYEAHGHVDFSLLQEKLSGSEDMVLLSQIYFEKNMPSIQLKDAVNSLNALKKRRLERRRDQLQLEIQRAEADKDKDRLASLDREKMEVIRQIYAL